MSLYTHFASSVLFPMHECLKGHTSVARLAQLEESQWWPAERLRSAQVAKLRDFLCNVGAQVPYYSAMFREVGFDPRRVESVDEIQCLPFLTKQGVRANQDAMKACDASGLARYNTGGSSGEPLGFFIGKDRKSHDVAAKWRSTRWWGVDIGDPEIVVWGSPIELGSQDRLKALRDRILRTRLLPAFEMSEAKLDEFLAVLRAHPPRMLFGYPSALSHIAEHAAKRGIPLDRLGIVVAFVTSERLYDHQRHMIAATFGCGVANGYGGRDAGFIAHECPAGGMHISAEDIVVEIVDHEGRPLPAGEPGEVVVTHLATRDFPFVRYRTGDVGAIATAPCTCGRTLPMLQDLQGRTTDFVVARDGTIMHGLALIYSVRDLPGIEQFKIIQHDLEHTEVQLVVSSTYQTVLDDRIQAEFCARLGAGVRISVHHVTSIPPEASGKYRYVVSKVTAGEGLSKEAACA